MVKKSSYWCHQEKICSVFVLLQLGEFLFKNFFILFEKPNQNGFWVFPVRESEAKATILSFVYNRKKWLLFCLFIILSVIQRAVYIYTESDGSYNCFAGNGAHSSMCIGTTAQYRMVPLIRLQFHDKIKVIKGVFWHLMCFNEIGQLWFFVPKVKRVITNKSFINFVVKKFFIIFRRLFSTTLIAFSKNEKTLVQQLQLFSVIKKIKCSLIWINNFTIWLKIILLYFI